MVYTGEPASASVVVLSTPACPYCKRAKEALTAAGIPYAEVNVGTDAALRQMVRDVSGSRTVPQIFVGGRSVGGSDDLARQLADGSFQQLLKQHVPGAGGALPPELLAAVMAAQDAAALRAKDAGAAAASGEGAALAGLEARMLREAAEGGLPRSSKASGDKTLRVFSGRDLLDWLRGAGEADPLAAARRLLAANRVATAAAEAEPTAAEALEGAAEGLALTLVAEAPSPAPGQPLNGHYVWQGPARPATGVVTSLRGLILELYDAHLSPDGRTVDYRALKSDARFKAFVDATAELQKVDLSPLSREELMAFAINTYNALIVHALVVHGTRMGLPQRAVFFSRTANYVIGGVQYTADDLEHGILRGNRAGAANLWSRLGLHGLAGGHWKQGDPRLSKIVMPRDPRIHFALVCGARSCPPIKLYTPDNLEEGLAAAAEAFCAGEVAVDPDKAEVTVSMIFKWYEIDFGSNKVERLRTISQWLQEPARGQLLGLLDTGRNVQLKTRPYDWSINGTDV